MAASVLTEPRFTRDVDVAVAASGNAAAWVEAARLATMIQRRGYDRERDLVAALSELRDGG